MTRSYRRLHGIGLLLVGFSLAGIANAQDGGAAAGAKLGSRIGEVRQQLLKAELDKLKDLRAAIQQLDAAVDAGDRAETRRLAREVRTKWAAIRPRAKEALEAHHPGTAAKIEESLREADALVAQPNANSTSGTTASTTTVGSPTLLVAPVVPGVLVPPPGAPVPPPPGVPAGAALLTTSTTGYERDTTIETRNGNTVSTDKTVSRDGNTVTSDRTTTVTNADGKTLGSVNVDGTRTTTPGQTTAHKDISTTNAQGQTKNYDWDRNSTRQGNTASTTGTLTNADSGKTLRTYQGNTTKNGNSAARTTSPTTSPIAAAPGAVAGGKQTAARTRTYTDDFDVVGNRGNVSQRSAPAHSAPARSAPARSGGGKRHR